MKTLLLFPPQWMPISPHFALPTLLGQFEGTTYEATVMDLNVDFYNKILTKSYVENALKTAKEMLPELKQNIKKYFDINKKYDDYTFSQKVEIAKASLIGNTLKKHGDALTRTAFLIDKSVEVCKSKEHFYNPSLYVSSINNIKLALEICSMPYYPTRIDFISYSNELLSLDYESIKYFVFDEGSNIFKPYFESVIDKIKAENAEYIGISINSSSQIVAGLTLANMLKKETNAHINIGGNHFGRVTDALEKYPEFFELFCDSVLVEEGEIPVIELTKHINGEICIEEVPNLMYLKDGKVQFNDKVEPKKLNELKTPSLEGYDLSQYFTPEIVMPFPSSRGCYWRKCSFCDHDFGMFYNIKNIDKLVEEIKTFKNKYGITKFEFIDEAISPSYMEAMSKRFIEEKLDVNFFCDARLENGFTKEVCELARSAGLRMVLWGFESGSKKIMKLINKGIDIDNRLNILRTAREADIYNFAFIFFGFPAETRASALKTIKVICDNTDIINSYGKSVFTMGKHTKLREAPEKYGVVGKTRQVSEFSPTYEYNAIGMTKKELDDVINLCTKRANKAYGNALSFHLLSREILFLYLCRYGADQVCNYKFKG
ncbi:MAG: radical SAM protein [Cyanobacteria bacterium SIG29]|nr:radical SAM protein [Cyanobacteria bacterium SIG29]